MTDEQYTKLTEKVDSILGVMRALHKLQERIALDVQTYQANVYVDKDQFDRALRKIDYLVVAEGKRQMEKE